VKVGFILNPAAGSAAGFQKQLHKAVTYLEQRGCTVELWETQCKNDGIRLARQAANEQYDVAVAVGGDGTINEVCNGLTGSHTAMAVLPAGTGNVYAAELGIPIWGPLKPDAIVQGADIIMTGRHRRVDLGRVYLANGASRYFLMWCGIGLDAAITRVKPASGQSRELNYATWAISGLMVAYEFMGTPATLVTDDETVKQRVLMAVVSNGQLYGRIWRLAPEAKMDDGQLDVAVMTGHGWPSTVRYVVGATLKQHIKDPDFFLYRTTRLSLTAKHTLPIHVDAEPFGSTPAQIEVAPLALKVIVPHHAPEKLFQQR
jgi:YegS/Rv2252/BmrU family lipid kinase